VFNAAAARRAASRKGAGSRPQNGRSSGAPRSDALHDARADRSIARLSTSQTNAPSHSTSARELLVVALASAVLFGALLSGALFDAGVALVGPGDGAFTHAAARFVARQWLAGDAPWWNPHVAAGAPALGNPLLGVLDPQSLFVLLGQRIGGEGGVALALAWLAWARLCAAALGAFALARRLGLGAGGAWIAALSFAGSGFLAVHAVEPSGRVIWIAPWVLLGIERLRDTHGARGHLTLAVSLALALAAGHLETAFFVGVGALAWSLALWRSHPAAARAALLALGCGVALAAPVLAPAFEYVTRSTLAVARSAARAPLDALDLGLLLVVVGALWRARELGARLGPDPVRQQRFAVGAALALTLLALLVSALSPWPETLARAWLFDLRGRPGEGVEYFGAESYADAAQAWCAPLALILAVAALLSPNLGGLRHARVLTFGAAVALALSWSVPGAVQLAHVLPFVELCDVRHAAGVGALFVGLLAGAGFERATPWARWTAAASCALGVGALVLLASRDSVPPAPEVAVDESNGVVELTKRPAELLARGRAQFEGWIHPDLVVESAQVRVESVDAGAASGHEFALPLELSRAAWSPEEAPRAPDGALWFRAAHLDVGDLEPGASRFTLVLRTTGGRVLTERCLASAVVHRPRITRWETLTLVYVSAFAVLVLGLGVRWSAFAAAALLAASSVWFHFGLHVTRPLAELFAAPSVARALAHNAGEGRVLAERDAFAPHSALALGWRQLDARDGLGLARFDALRPQLVFEGVHPMLGLSATNFDSNAPLARVLDVRALVSRGQAPRSEFGAPQAEGGLSFHATREPFGVARCVAETVHPDLIARHPRDFDSRTQAHLSGDVGWEAHEPLTRASVELVERTNHALALRVTLDGDGLLVLGEQRFPGWSVFVDGQPARLLGVDTLFSGVALSAGEWRVEFRYRPTLLRVGALGAALGLAGLVALCFRGRATTRA